MFTPRLTRPTSGNKYYIRKANGGYSNAIAGKVKSTGKADAQCNVLANCVGYSYGRFNEVGGYGYCKYLSPVNAENFPEYASGLQFGNEPKLGAIICWQKGTTLKGSDGAGHVANVEQILADGSIVISQSGYNSTVFWTETIKKGDGNWRCSWMGSNYKFRCFIYNPAVSEAESKIVTLKTGARGEAVKIYQTNMNRLGYGLDVDGSYGPASTAAAKDFQKKYGLEVDGIFGIASQTKLAELIADMDKKPTYLGYGMKGEDVKTLQINLNKLGASLAVDGSFGPATLAAVKAYQKKKGLEVDGYVGDKTKAAINTDIEILSKRNAAIKDLKLIVDNTELSCWSVNIDNEDYIRLSELVDLGLAKSVAKNSAKNIMEVKTK